MLQELGDVNGIEGHRSTRYESEDVIRVGFQEQVRDVLLVPLLGNQMDGGHSCVEYHFSSRPVFVLW